jgi:apolipoprotein N-acyltransferase
MPIWVLWFGWFALAAYLSIYLPLFVLISRALVHRFKVPTIIAAPVVFTGLEWIRVTFLTGFGLACLSHSQYRHGPSMQIAEYFGAYGVTFAIVFVAAAIAVASGFAWKTITTRVSIPARLLHASVAAAAMGGVLFFGNHRLQQDALLRKSAEAHKHLKVALIQTSIDTILKPKTIDQVEREFLERCDLTHAAQQVAGRLDLVVWPESSFPYGQLLSDLDSDRTKQVYEESQRRAWQAAVGHAGSFSGGAPLLVGSSTHDPENETAFNSALLFDEKGSVKSSYHKQHLVMFGEYFPVLSSIPILKDFVKGFSSWNAGTSFTRMKTTNDVSLAPNVCFETTVPHFIRRQINSLEQSGEEIDVLVNVTNDGWFFGTSCLDLHLACNTFRAVEMRKPLLVSANTGFSAHIDEYGRHVKLGPRRKEAELICDVRVPLPMKALYRGWGAWVPLVMGWITLIAGVASYFASRKNIEPPS